MIVWKCVENPLDLLFIKKLNLFHQGLFHYEVNMKRDVYFMNLHLSYSSYSSFEMHRHFHDSVWVYGKLDGKLESFPFFWFDFFYMLIMRSCQVSHLRLLLWIGFIKILLTWKWDEIKDIQWKWNLINFFLYKMQSLK